VLANRHNPPSDAESYKKQKSVPREEPIPAPAGKNPYQELAFRYEREFETLALSCGKNSSTQFQCRFNRKTP
jgi:hypothetical protein